MYIYYQVAYFHAKKKPAGYAGFNVRSFHFYYSTDSYLPVIPE